MKSSGDMLLQLLYLTYLKKPTILPETTVFKKQSQTKQLVYLHCQIFVSFFQGFEGFATKKLMVLGGILDGNPSGNQSRKTQKKCQAPKFPKPTNLSPLSTRRKFGGSFSHQQKKQMLHTFPHQLEVFWTAKAVPDIFIYNP